MLLATRGTAEASLEHLSFRPRRRDRASQPHRSYWRHRPPTHPRISLGEWQSEIVTNDVRITPYLGRVIGELRRPTSGVEIRNRTDGEQVSF